MSANVFSASLVSLISMYSCLFIFQCSFFLNVLDALDPSYFYDLRLLYHSVYIERRSVEEFTPILTTCAIKWTITVLLLGKLKQIISISSSVHCLLFVKLPK